MSPCPVMKTMGMSIFAFASSAWKSSPLKPGNRTSRTRQVGQSGNFACRNSGAEANAVTRSPTDASRLDKAARIDASSSMTKTIGFSSAGGLIVSHPSIHAADRQNHSKNRAARLRRGRGKLTGMPFDDHPAKRQSQSHSLRFRRDEWVEYVGGLLGIDSGP